MICRSTSYPLTLNSIQIFIISIIIENIIIKVIDEAGGIPENIRDKLFTKILTTRGMQGTGLGLYLAKPIIEDEFNGKIYFETETDKGTTFYIILKKMEEKNGKNLWRFSTIYRVYAFCGFCITSIFIDG